MKTNPYLNFDGQAAEAFAFYGEAFGTQPAQLIRYKDVPMQGVTLTPEDAEKIMNINLPIGDDCVLMGSDPLAALGHPVVPGNDVFTNLTVDSRAEADRLFAALSQGGKVEMPPTDMPWGDYWSSFRDKFGMGWMITHPPGGAGTE